MKFQAKPGTQADSTLTKSSDQQGNLTGLEASVDLPGFAARKPEIIGHELTHIEEVLDTGKLQSERLDEPGVWRNSQGFETKQAQEAERIIKNELHSNRATEVQEVDIVCKKGLCEIQ